MPTSRTIQDCVCGRREPKRAYTLHTHLAGLVLLLAIFLPTWFLGGHILAVVLVGAIVALLGIMKVIRLLMRHSLPCAVRWSWLKTFELAGEFIFQALTSW